MKGKEFQNIRLKSPRSITRGFTNHEHPVISPDGRFLSFYAGEWGSLAVIVTDFHGRFIRVASPPGGNNTQPAWHPEKLQLAFRHNKGANRRWEIWTTSLVGDTIPYPLLADPRFHYKHPCYSPCGNFMAYFSDENTPGIFHLWQLDLTTYEKHQLTFGDSQNHCHPVYSPNAKRVVFHAYEGIDQAEPPITNLYELSLKSGSVRQLTDKSDQYKHPFYLDKDTIIYHHRNNKTLKRWVEAMRLKTGETVKLTSGKNNDKHPFPWMDRKGKMFVIWSSKKLGDEAEGEPSSYDIFISRLIYK